MRKANDNITRLSTKLDAFKLETIGPLIPLFLQLSEEMVKTSTKSDELSLSGQALKTVFETIAVLGANVIYVFKGVGTEPGGIAAQIVALGSGDFKAFSAIGTMMKEDAAQARKDVDALSDRLLNPKRATPSPSPDKPTSGITNAPVTPNPSTPTRAERQARRHDEWWRIIRRCQCQHRNQRQPRWQRRKQEQQGRCRRRLGAICGTSTRNDYSRNDNTKAARWLALRISKNNGICMHCVLTWGRIKASIVPVAGSHDA